ncbi:MAG: hypothetical protein H7246_15940, partial [Phycisphaerae bacterium]|nr:hypothetical protein [Saprospiraceae bacterium]
FSNGNGVKGSDPLFDELAKEVSAMSDFSTHEAMFFRLDTETNCLYMIFVHSTKRGQAQGGTRLKYEGYEKLEGAIMDGMRLSKGMTDKNSISEIWWGGGKAVICPLTMDIFNEIDKHKMENKDKIYLNLDLRKSVFVNFGKFVASLGGIYIAAEDMNTKTTDMLTILSVCRFVTCLPPEVGGSANPSGWTAQGIFKSMLATVMHFENKNDLSGNTVNIQGLGNVGLPLAELVLKSGARLNVYDTDAEAYETLASYGDKVKAVSANEIYTIQSDIFAPCAIGGILNKDTIPLLNCRYVIGAANNQLRDFDEDYKLLNARNIIYLPDFFINRMGIINCANEQYGRLENDLKDEVEKVYSETLELLADCDATSKTPQEVALKWATEKGEILHPIWGHRSIQLLNNYIARTK